MNSTEDETDLYATRLEVNVYPAEKDDDGPAPGVNDEEMEQVEELIRNAGFYLAEDSYQVTRLTPAFVTTEENMAAVREVVKGLKEMYPNHEVEFAEGGVANNSTRDLFSGTQVVSVARRDQSVSDESSATDGDDANEETTNGDDSCVECGGELVEMEESDERYCNACGLVVDDSDTPEWRASLDRDGEEKQESNLIDDDTNDRWETNVERTDFATDIEIDHSPPEGEVVVGIVSEPYRTDHEYYRIEDAEEFFGDAWEDNGEMARLLHESDIEPFEELSLPRVDWVIPG